MLVEIGDTTPNGQKSNCLNDRSGKLNQLEANPLFSLSLLFFHPPPPLSRDGKNCRRPSFSLSLSDCEEGFEWNGRDYPDLLFPFSLSRHDIPLDRRRRRQEKNGLDNLDTESEKE